MSFTEQGVRPYWIGDLDNILLKSPEFYIRPQVNGVYGTRKSLSQQLEFINSTTQVLVS